MKSAAKNFLAIGLVLLSACSFNSVRFQKELGIKLADTLATKETVLLFYNLKKLSKTKIIFGQQDAIAYGIGWNDEPNRSDVKDLVHSYPGLYGWDFGFLQWEKNREDEKQKRIKWIREVFKRGGVNTFCWHYNNPVTEGSFYDTTIAVKYILPGRSYHKRYLIALDSLAHFAKSLVDEDGKPIPIIFRPFHEFDGNWFWWGKPFCTKEEFIELWKTTVNYLRDTLTVKNFIYAFSPDRRFKTEEGFLERYPGDDYVDIIGMDNYYDFSPDGDGLKWVTKKLKIVSNAAKQKNKIAAFTETGQDTIPDSLWWTSKLFKALDGDTLNLAYVMVWRNANKKHHFAPYKGHPSAPDFVEFARKEKILFEDHLPNLYSEPLRDNFSKTIDEKKKIDIMKLIGSRPLTT